MLGCVRRCTHNRLPCCAMADWGMFVHAINVLETVYAHHCKWCAVGNCSKALQWGGQVTHTAGRSTESIRSVLLLLRLCC
jgi:hypothetical protein